MLVNGQNQGLVGKMSTIARQMDDSNGLIGMLGEIRSRATTRQVEMCLWHDIGRQWHHAHIYEGKAQGAIAKTAHGTHHDSFTTSDHGALLHKPLFIAPKPEIGVPDYRGGFGYPAGQLLV
jgi:hypothetical protein